MTKALQRIIRHWKTGLSFGLGLSRSLGGPVTVHIEITNICNFRCIYCPQSNPDTHFDIIGRGKMSFEDYKIILDKIVAAWTLQEIVLTRDGEPLVHPELNRFIAYAANKGLDVTIGSNGSYFTPERVTEIIDNGLTKVKGDFCSDKKKFEELRAGAKWEQVLSGYRNLLEYSIKNKKKFHLVLVDLNSYDLQDKSDLQNSLQSLQDLFPYPDQYISVGAAMMHNAFDEAKVTLSASDKLSKRKYNLCHHPWIELVIDYKGNVVGCCRDLRSEYIIRNVLESDNIMKQIWNGSKMRHLRKNLANREPEAIPTCRKCDLPYGISYAGRGVLKKYLRFLRR